MWEDLEALIQWKRLTGTEGEAQAARYIRDRLEAEGIEVILHKFDAYISLPGSAELEILEPAPGRFPCTTHSYGATTGGDWVEGQAVRVDEKGNAAESVSGKIALIEGLVSPGMFFDIESQGAIAQIFVNKGEIIHELTVASVWGTPTPEDMHRFPHTPVASIPRSVGAPFFKALEEGKAVRLRLKAEVDTKWRSVEMPEAIVSAPGGGDDFFLASAHLDGWYQGAMDNATGDILLMELARVFHEVRDDLKRNVRLAFWIGHSHGRYAGSTWYADHFWDNLRDNCVGYFNIDQVGFRDGSVFRLLATEDISGWVHDVIERESGQDISTIPPGRNSDQSFWGLGIPSFAFRAALTPESDDYPPDYRGNGLPWYWHHKDDTLDKILPDLLLDHSQVHASTLTELLTLPVLPLDPSATVKVIQSKWKEFSEAAGDAFEVRSIQESLDRLIEQIGALLEKSKTVTDEDDARNINKTLLRLGSLLTPVLYTISGPYGQDAARAGSQLPGLRDTTRLGEEDDDKKGFLATRLIRERNRLSDALRSSLEEIERVLS
jgi:hypothetical protein